MKRNKQMAFVALGMFLTGCTGVMTKNQAAVVGATLCGTATAAGVATTRSHDRWVAAPAAIGSALLCGGLAYLMTEEPKRPAPPAPTTATGAEAETGSTAATAATTAATGTESGADDYFG